MKLTIKDYREIGMQLLGEGAWLSISALTALPFGFLFAAVLKEIHNPSPWLAVIVTLGVTSILTGLVALPFWGWFKLAQARKRYGDEQVDAFLQWLKADDDTSFQFR